MHTKTKRFCFASGAVLVAALSVFAASGGYAGVVNSPHDFSPTNPLYASSPIVTGGVCSACHIPHNAQDGVLWTRPLSGGTSTFDGLIYGNYRAPSALNMDGSTSTKPNYLQGFTLQCYDCHDSHAQSGSGGIDNKPDIALFASSHKPQDIAFGFTKVSSGSMTESAPGGTDNVSGYYENSPPFGSNMGADAGFIRSTLDNVSLAKTGGHYFKSGDPNPGTAGTYKGDKLPCSDCHDPHKWQTTTTPAPNSRAWQAFFSPRIPVTIPAQWNPKVYGTTPASTIVKASSYMANPLVVDSRDDAESRKMCLICHGTSSDSPSAIPPVTFAQVNPKYTNLGSSIVRPTAGISEHQIGSSVACVSCHKHNAIGASCTMCHGFPASPASPAATRYPSTFTPSPDPGTKDSHAKHYGGEQGAPRNVLPGYIYSFDCKVCHYGSAMGFDSSLGQHQNTKLSVVIQSLWTSKALGVSPYDNTNYFNPGVNGGGVSGELTSAQFAPGGNSCRNVYCHSAGRDVGAMTADNLADYPVPKWLSGQQHCNDCHGFGTDNTTITYGMPNYPNGAPGATRAINGRANSHPAHVINAKIECSVCHSLTATGVGASRAIKLTPPFVHVDNVKNVVFDNVRAIGGVTPYTAISKTCQVGCHGLTNTVQWGQSSSSFTCTACHTSQGAGTGAVGFTGVHQAHTDNSAAGAGRYRFACEQCHAVTASGGAANNILHAGGDDNVAGPSYAEVKFTDNAALTWTYGGAVVPFETVNTKFNPFIAAAVAPIYTDSATLGGTDNVNNVITWSQGTCNTVWCHSNANPASAGGGANTYRTPPWNGVLSCTGCHLGPDTQANMLAAPDRLSMGHSYHLPTGAGAYSYAFTCDECHAKTVPNDCTTAILDAGGFDYHLNGSKLNIFGSTTVDNSSINDNTLSYNQGAFTCTLSYCHSNGKTQAAPFTARLAPPAWNVAPAYTCATNPCHASTSGTAAANFTAEGDNSAHTMHPYGCNACHVSTTSDNLAIAVGGYALHVNGVKDVTISSAAGFNFDNDAVANNNYTLASKTCAGVACHGGKSVAWTDCVATTSCDACHTTTNGVAVAANSYDYTFSTGTPTNMSKVSPTLFRTRGHGLNGTLPWTGGTNPGSMFSRAMVCGDCHDMTVQHNTPGNPFRFRATVGSPLKAVTFDNVDTLCYACHTSAAALRHAKAVTGGGTSAWEHNQRCVDCHDVHGQGANIFMVYESLAWQDNGAPAYATSNGYGIPYPPATRTTVVFTGDTLGSNFATGSGSSSGTGICEVCHERTVQYSRTLGAGSHPTAVCTTCHMHDAGFKGGGCKGCHGGDDGTQPVINNAPNITKYWMTTGHGQARITVPAVPSGTRPVECEDCHDVSLITGNDHRTTVSSPSPPGNINTYNWPGKTINSDTTPNANTSHLKAGFLNTAAATRADIARTFGNYCLNTCHTWSASLMHGPHTTAPSDVTRFGTIIPPATKSTIIANPKLYSWMSYTTTYVDDFYKTLSPWIDSDIRVSGLADTTNYAVCISCHDPHGTGATDKTWTRVSSGVWNDNTNHMVRGNFHTDMAGFCTKVCHQSVP